tara:strand:- start:6105 stop:6422 length:318 start_codon:yes stop_codon:yes gene_type:complete
MLENTIKNEVGDLLNKVKSNCFMPNANPTARQAFGLMMSKFFKWSGICIAEAAVAALRDANFRSLADNLECLIEYELSESGQAGCEIISKRRLNFLIRAAEQANG